jgi:acetyl-CoA carboxylase beta subunit
MALWNLGLAIAQNLYRNKQVKDEIERDPAAAAAKGYYKCPNCGKYWYGKNLQVCQKCGAKFQIPSTENTVNESVKK